MGCCAGGEQLGEGRGMVAREEKMYSKEGSRLSSITVVGTCKE